MRIISIFVLLIVSSIGTLAQSGLPSMNELSFDAKYCAGAIYKHTKKVHIDPPAWSQEFELSISHRTYGKRQWERINNCPIPSLNFCYSQFGDDLGNAISVYPGIEWAVLRREKFNWNFKVGGGIGYATKRWTRTDTLNNYLGSHLNNFTTIQTNVSIPLSKKTELQAGGRMSHMSNGAFRIPNFGINLFTAYLGLNYYPGKIQKRTFEKAAKPSHRKFNIGLRSSIAWAEHGTPDGALHNIYNQSLFVSTPLLRKHNFFAGVDIAYDKRALSSYKYTMQSGKLSEAATASTAFIGAELLYGRMGIPFQFGVYLKNLRNQDAVWYQKFGFHYYLYRNDKTLLKRAFVGPMLKSNKINADYIEFCLGAMF